MRLLLSWLRGGSVAVPVFALLTIVITGAGCSGGGSNGRADEPVAEAPVPEEAEVFEIEALQHHDVALSPEVIVISGVTGTEVATVAIERATGNTLWVEREEASPVSFAGRSTITSGVYVQDRGLTMNVYDLMTGEFRWSTPDSGYDSVRVHGQYVVVKEEGGRQGSPGVTFDAATGGEVFSEPVRAISTELGYAQTAERTTKMIDLATGETLWEIAGWLTFPPGDYDQRIMQDGAKVMRIDMATGEQLWRREFEETPSLRFTRDYDYVLLRRDLIRSSDDYEVLDGLTGETLWTVQKPDGGGVAIADRTIVETNGEDVDYTGGGDDVDGQTFLSAVTGYDIVTGETVWQIDGLSDVTGYVTQDNGRWSLAPRDNGPALVLFEQDPDKQRAGLESVQMFDPDTGKALSPVQTIEGTIQKSGFHVVGSVGLIVRDGQVRSLDGTVLGEYSGAATTLIRGDALIVLADEVLVIEW